MDPRSTSAVRRRFTFDSMRAHFPLIERQSPSEARARERSDLDGRSSRGHRTRSDPPGRTDQSQERWATGRVSKPTACFLRSSRHSLALSCCTPAWTVVASPPSGIGLTSVHARQRLAGDASHAGRCRELQQTCVVPAQWDKELDPCNGCDTGTDPGSLYAGHPPAETSHASRPGEASPVHSRGSFRVGTSAVPTGHSRHSDRMIRRGCKLWR